MNKKMIEMGSNRSEIRELFEYGKALKNAGGKVCDLTLGNPSVKTPDWVTNTLIDGLQNPAVHSYTSAQGSLKARGNIAKFLNDKSNVTFSPDGIILTCGAAPALCAIFKTLIDNKNDEIIALSPYFPEYKAFVESTKAKFKTVNFLDDFSPDVKFLDKIITKNTKALIINSPNNPSGKIYTETELVELCKVLNFHSKKYNHPIYLISDEPYREIVFTNATQPSICNFYSDTIICYSYSKSLSLPGERIGYIAIPDQISSKTDLYAGILGSLRSFGHVCAPSLFQYLIENFKPQFSDFLVYENNKTLFYNNLTQLGYECNNPQGAFYLMVKSPNGNSQEFSERAKKLGLLVVPADSFGAKGWVRIATCVTTDTVLDAISLFEKLSKTY